MLACALWSGCACFESQLTTNYAVVPTHEQEIDTLEEISRVLGDSSELSLVFQRAMTLMSERMPIERASLVVVDPVRERLQIVASVGLSQAEQDRGRYELGEGVTGRVIATGEAAVIPNLADSAEFLNRTRSRRLDEVDEGDLPLSFVCLPIRDGEATVGAIAVDLLYRGEESLASYVRLIKIISGLIAQTLRIHNRVQVEKDRWVEETQQLRENLHSRYRFDNIIGS
ncbi:MAG: GAF domain-containing protein, partial [Planctomycetota bacterium]